MRTIPTPDPKRATTASGKTAIAALICLPLNVIFGGLVVRYLYHRLMVPTFPSIPQHIGIAAAIGLSLFVGYLTSDFDESKLTKDDPRSFAEKEITWLAIRAFVVVTALVIGWFM